MSSFIACGAQITVGGGQSVATMAARMAAVPIDMFGGSLPSIYALILSSDTTITAVNVITRMITFALVPSITATATAVVAPGDFEGPINNVVVTAAGADYAAPPIVSFPATQKPTAVARAHCTMGVSDVLLISGGTGWGVGTTTMKFIRGQLATRVGNVANQLTYLPPGMPYNPTALPISAQATGTVQDDGAGHLTGITITSPGGPYQVPPEIVLTGTGTGAEFGVGLKVLSVVLDNPGAGYLQGNPTVSFLPVFKSYFPDPVGGFPDQRNSMRYWMKNKFQQFLNMPVNILDPVLA